MSGASTLDDGLLFALLDVVAEQVTAKPCKCSLHQDTRAASGFYQCDRCKLLERHAEWKKSRSKP